jgi:hypothetical protein
VGTIVYQAHETNSAGKVYTNHLLVESVATEAWSAPSGDLFALFTFRA